MSALDNRAMVFLLFGIVTIVVTLTLRHVNRNSPINLEDLLLGADGRISKASALLFGSFLLSSWVVGYQTLNGTLSDVVFSGYLAVWVTPTLAAMFKGKHSDQPSAPSVGDHQ